MRQVLTYAAGLAAAASRAHGRPNTASTSDTSVQSGQSQPLDLAPAPAAHAGAPPGTAQRFEFIESNNWAGAVVPAPDGESFTAASGTFNVPDVSQPDGDAGLHAAAAWVGIDGAQNKAAILQAGCNFYSTTQDGNSYSCWYEWFPNPMSKIDGFVPSPGDQISVAVQMLSPSSGTATLTNENTGAAVTQTLSAPNPTATLTGQNAEFIVEDYGRGAAGLVPLTDWCEVTFTSPTIGGASGASYDLSGANIIQIVNRTTGYLVGDPTIPADDMSVTIRRDDNNGSGWIGC